MMASRVAPLPATGKPYVLQLWLRSYERFWKDEVDQVRVVVATPIEQPVMRYVTDELRDAGAHVISVPKLSHSLSHGQAIARLLADCDGELVMLIDEDALVLRSGEVYQCFQLLNGECDAVAVPLGDCTPAILARSKEMFDLDIAPHFSPNLFFARSGVFSRTNGEFDPKTWRAGVYIPELDFVCEQDEQMGRFVWASIPRCAEAMFGLYRLSWRTGQKSLG